MKIHNINSEKVIVSDQYSRVKINKIYKNWHKDRGLIRAFSMIELAASLAIFLIASAIVTLAIGNSSITAAEQRNNQEVINKLTSIVKLLEENSYSSFSDNTWVRPLHCEDSLMDSCFTAFSHEYRVSYIVTPITNSLAAAILPPTYQVVASTTLPSGVTYTMTTNIIPPDNLLSQSQIGVVKVSVINTSSYNGPLYLYSAKSGFHSVISNSSPLGNGKSTIITYPAGQCSPCRIALSPGGDSYIGKYSIDVSALPSDGYNITAAKGLTSTTITIRNRSKAVISLWARNSDGSIYSPSLNTAGSICLYISFFQGNENHNLSGCNSSSEPGLINYEYYKAGKSYDDFLAAIPTDVPLTLSTDLNISGACPNPDDYSETPLTTTVANSFANFVSGYECTAWTWDRPSTINKNGSEPMISGPNFEGSRITLSSSQYVNEFSALWKSPTLAAGVNNGDILWYKPRMGRITKTYISQSEPILSDTSCTAGIYCNSGGDMLPYPTTGRFNTPLGNQWAVVYDGNGKFDLTVKDPDSLSNNFSVKLSSLPSKASLYSDSSQQNIINSNATISTCSSSSCTVSLYYSGNSTDSIGITVTQSGSSKEYIIGISNNQNNIWGVVASTYLQNFSQGGKRGYKVTVYNFAGEPSPNTSLSTSATTLGFTASNYTATSSIPATQDCPALNPGDGCIIATSNSSTPSGTYDIINSSAGGLYSASVRNYITPVPATLNIISGSNITQGGVASIQLQLFDGANNAISNEAVYLTSVSSSTSSWSPVAGSSNTSCITNSQGICTISVPFSLQQSSGQYTLAFASGSAVASKIITVAQSVSLPSLPPITISQGGVINTYITVSDGAGMPMSGVTPTLSNISGLTFLISPSDTSGRANLQITASQDITKGTYTTTVSTDGSSSQLKIKVNNKVTSVTGTLTNSIPQGYSSTFSFLAKDSNNVVVPFAKIYLQKNIDILTPNVAISDSTGKFNIVISAKSTSSTGMKSIVLTDSFNNIVGTLIVNVTTGIAGLTPLSSITLGSTSNLSLMVQGVTGDAVGSITITAESNSKYNIEKHDVTTDNNGIFSIDLDTSSLDRAQIINLEFSVLGKIYIVPVAVL